jgi:hypothetical protein
MEGAARFPGADSPPHLGHRGGREYRTDFKVAWAAGGRQGGSWFERLPDSRASPRALPATYNGQGLRRPPPAIIALPFRACGFPGRRIYGSISSTAPSRARRRLWTGRTGGRARPLERQGLLKTLRRGPRACRRWRRGVEAATTTPFGGTRGERPARRR